MRILIPDTTHSIRLLRTYRYTADFLVSLNQRLQSLLRWMMVLKWICGRPVETSFMQAGRSDPTTGLDSPLGGVNLALMVLDESPRPRGCALVVTVLAQVAGTRDGLTPSAASGLLRQISSALMLLYHHVDGLLGVVEVEFVVLGLLLLGALLQLVVIVVQWMFRPVMVYVSPTDVVDRAGTATPTVQSVAPRARLPPSEPRTTFGCNRGRRTPKDLLLQLHLLAMLLSPVIQWLLLHQV